MGIYRQPDARYSGHGESVSVVAWMGQPGPLLEAAWSLATVFHVKDQVALLHLVRAQAVSGVVLDVATITEDARAIVAEVRAIAPQVVILALLDAPPNAPITTVLCRTFDLCISRHTTPQELDMSLRMITLRSTRRMAENGVSDPEESPATLRERLRHLEGLVQTTFTISRNTDDTHDIMRDLRGAAQVVLDVDDMVVLQVDDDLADLSDTLFGNAPPEYIEVCRAQMHALPPERRTTYVGDEVLLRDPAGTSDSTSPRVREAEALGAHSYMRLPLLIDQQLIGFVAFYAREPDRFSGTHVQLGRLFVTQVANTVRNMRVYLRLQQAEQRQSAISQMARLVAELLELEPVLQRIVQEAVRLIEARAAQIMLREPDDVLVIRAVENVLPENVGDRVPLGMGQAGKVALSGEPSVVVNYPQWEHAIEELRYTLPEDAVLYGVPLSYRGEVLGVLQVTSGLRSAAEINEALEVLLTLAPQAATAIAKAQLHEQVEQDRRQLRAILEHTTASIAVCDAESRVLQINPALERVLARIGQSAETLYGQSLIDIICEFLPENPPNLTNLEAPIEISLGEAGEFVVHIAPIANSEGVIERYVGVAQEVSEIRRADRVRSNMLGILTHDMGNLVMLARNPIEMLEDPTLTPIQHEQLRNTLMHSIIRMEQLVIDMGNLDRAEQSGVETSKPYNLAEIVRAIVAEQTPDAVQKSITLTYHEVRLPSHPLRGIEVLIRQAIGNLISNAIKYTPDSGHVDVALDIAGDKVLVRVADDGLGISSENLRFIFDPFFRAKSDRRIAGIPGTGLGLSLVKAIAVRHGGHVEVHSQVEVGSVFTFYLPLDERLANPADSIIRLDLSQLVRPHPPL